jgi:hypothetical protein
LKHSDDDTPVPTWQQVTRSVHSANPAMAGHVTRIIVGAEVGGKVGRDEQAAAELWNAWPGNYRRSTALLIDKIFHEGWLDSVGSMAGWPWDGAFLFWPVATARGQLDEVLDAKARVDRVYTRCGFGGGLAAFLSGWNHPRWKQSWVENDTRFASLHVGIREDGCAEVHLDLFNSLYTNGAPRSETVTLPGLGSYNRLMLGPHRKWEGRKYGSLTRTSANLYHLMRGRVPLCF